MTETSALSLFVKQLSNKRKVTTTRLIWFLVSADPHQAQETPPPPPQSTGVSWRPAGHDNKDKKICVTARMGIKIFTIPILFLIRFFDSHLGEKKTTNGSISINIKFK